MNSLVRPPIPTPLSAAQASRLFQYALNPDGRGTDNIIFTVRLHGGFSATAIEQALRQLVQRHPMLRARFVQQDGAYATEVCDGAGFALAQAALDGIGEAALAERIWQDCRVPFDLGHGMRLRACIYRNGDHAVLALVFDHLAVDGWSFWRLLDELGALLDGSAAPAGPQAGYADYVAWQRGWLHGSDAQRQFAYWERTLAHPAPALRLPFARAPGSTGAHADHVSVILDCAQAARLRAFAQAHNASIFAVLLAAYQLLLWRETGEEHIAVGSPMPARSDKCWDAVAGDFVNMVTIDSAIDPHQSVSAFVKTVRGNALRAMANQDYPFPLLVEKLNPPREANQHPFFQAGFVFQNARQAGKLRPVWSGAGEVVAWGGLQVSGFALKRELGVPGLQLVLEVIELDEQVRCDFKFDLDVIDRATAQRLAGHFRAQLDGMFDNPAGPVSGIDLLDQDERDLVLRGFNATSAGYPRDRTIHALFEEQVHLRPQAAALVFEGDRMSYGELNRRANRVAHYLRSQGVQPDDRVAISIERCFDLVVGLLGILKAGAAYVPLDPAYPSERLAYMLGDCAARTLLTHTGVQALLAAAAPRQMAALQVLRLDADAQLLDVQPDTDPDAAAVGLTARNLAYVIYTSGSTGMPKGVMNEHIGVVNRLLWGQQQFGIDANERVLQKTPVSFDVSAWEFFMPLVSGAQLVIARPGGHLDPHYLAGLVDEAGITTIHFVPSMLQAFLDVVGPGQCRSLVRIKCSGEGVPYALQQRALARLPHVELHNLYGPTEASIEVTHWHCRPGVHEGIVPMGRPVANTQMYILDANLRPTPLGVPGEVHIAGVQVARGYLNRPELTAERFIPDPFSSVPGARMYKTGDLGRWLADGAIEYLGRNDFQVKIRGQRIELGEIEARLAACDGVREAVVVAREDTPGDQRLVAYFVPHGAQAPAVAALREQLAAVLPAHMLPNAFVTLPAFPLSPSGKLERRALPAPSYEALAQRAFEAPAGAAEQALAATWQELLGVERVSRNDNFFELGGHSLMLVNMIAQLKQRGMHIDVKTAFAHPALYAMAAAMTAEGGPSAAVPANLIPQGCDAITPDMLPLVSLTQRDIDLIAADVPGGARNIQDIYALAPLQEGMLFHYMLQSGSDAYLLRQLMAFDSRSRLDGFLAAFQQVIARHDVLRTAIFWSGLSQPAQVVLRSARLQVEQAQLDTATPAIDQLRALTDPSRCRLDLRQAPLIRATIAADEREGAWLLALHFHHMVCDHVTLEFVVHEIHAILQGQERQLPPSFPFRNFVAQAQSVPVAAQEAYFSAQLAGVEEPTAPFGILDVQGNGAAIGEAHLPLDPTLAQAIRSCASQHGFSPAPLFHAAWARVLGQCCGRDDVVFGTVLSGRLQHSDGADRALGVFINTLPLRVSLAASVEQVVRQTHERLTGLLEHEQASLALAQRCSAVGTLTPLFTSLLNFRHTGGAGASGQAWEGIRAFAGEERTNYPITMSVDDMGDGFVLTAQCVAGIDAGRLNGYFATALAGLVDAFSRSPDKPMHTLSILPDAERALLQDGFNDTAAAYPQDLLVHTLFEQQARLQPQAAALVFEGQQLSYGELNRRANQLAHHLLSLGVRPDDRVAISMERSCELVVGLLGILKAGAAYVPLDPAYPADRLAYMLGDCAARALLTQSRVQALLAAAAPRHMAALPVLCLDADAALLDQHPGADPAPAAIGLAARHLAYVIYTSGSTGMPKGVMNEHAAVVNRLLWAQQQFGISRDDRVLQKTPFSFDVSVWEFFLPLMCGAQLVIARPGGHQDPRYLAGLVASAGITTMHFVPSMLQAFLEEATPEQCGSLVRIKCSGEALPYALQQRALARLPHVELHNLYGPTEAAVDVTWWRCRAGIHEGIVPIGRPVANTRIHILDARLQPVPLGVAGEIHIGGVQVARGYLNRPELTAERFIRDPFSPDPDARLYKTGDLGRWLGDGALEYLGRNDFQVKVRGMRIELGEIEAVLATCDGVRDAVVVAREDVAGDQRLVAYLVPHDGRELAPASLRELLSARIPAHMVPAAFVVMPAFPLSPNGKLDRKALPAPELDGASVRAYEAPIGDIETTLAAAWQDLLQAGRVGRHDNFFDLGGHSLLAVRLASRVRQAFGVDLPVRELFLAATLKDLAALVEKAGASEATAIGRADRGQPLPLSWAQQRLWFLDQFDHAASVAYHMPAALRLHGKPDRAALRAALDRIVARHENLRTCFPADDSGQPVQRVAPETTAFSLRERDLRGATACEVEAEVAAEARAPFDLATGPLIRGQLLQLAEDEHILLVTQHHIISDGWSIGVLVKEFSSLYGAFSGGQPDPLPALPIQYADYAAWQRQWLQGERLDKQRAFWRAHLDGAPSLLELPTDRPRPAVQGHAGGTLAVTLPADLAAGVRELGKRHGATLFMTLLAGWAALLARLSGQHDIVVGTPIANRQRAEVEQLIGFFVNTLALRTNMESDPSVAQLLAQVKATTLGAYEHQDLPFEQVVEALNPARSMGHSPVFQAVLVLDNTPRDETLSLPGLTLSPVEAPRASTQFDLSLSLTESGAAIEGTLEYASALFDHATVARWMDYFKAALAAMVADDRQRVSQLPLLPPTARAQLLAAFNDTAAPYPHHRLVHTVFEDHAASRPDAIALSSGATHMSYAELNRRANRLAHHLISLGVRPDDRVAICAERSIDSVVGLLGILKAGAAYVPLDPAYPQERLAFMLRDSAPVALLTQQRYRAAFAPDLPLILLDGDPAPLAADCGENPDPAERGIGARNLAYVIYTSGSTGTPKGVMVEHRSVLRLAINGRSTPITAHDCIAHCASPVFDATTWEIWGALLNGARLLIVPQPVLLDPARLNDALLDGGVTALWLTVGLFNQYVDALEPAFARLDRLMIGGDTLQPATVARALGKPRPPRRLVNGYGPTETTTFAATFDIPASADGASPVPLGRPIDNTRIYILDTQMTPVPPGVTGEIYIAGPGVARGYLNRPDLTAERFLADPFGLDADARMYKSGDLGRWRPDGTIEYLGRNDQQVKIRGYRIELGEIEARLAGCAGVREALVLAQEHAGDKRLVAYIVADDGNEPTAAGLRDQASAALPSHMVPAAFVVLPAFPLTPNGKVDRRALPRPDDAALASRPYAAPAGEMEGALAAIWQELLRVERAGRHDHFFELGGHSLLTVQLLARLRDQFHVDVSVKDIFEKPILSDLAAFIATLQMETFLGDEMQDMRAELDSMTEAELLAILEMESGNE